MSLYLGENLISGQATLVGESRNIGQIIPSAIPLTDAGLHLLDGALIQGDGIYSAFVTYIAGIVSTYPNLFVTESAWQSAVSSKGVCGKFVYDSENRTVRLPKITGIIEGTTDVSALGDLVEAGLPNITGRFGSGEWSNRDYTQGAFYKNGSYSEGATGGDARNLVSFNASRSSSIYGNSSTVQPQTIKVLYYIVIATSTKTDIEVDIDQVATDLNGKADTDLTNTSPTSAFATALNTAGIRTVIQTYVNGTSWYRVYSDGWCEQGGQATVPSNDNAPTINLLKSYKDTNYNVSFTRYNTSTGTISAGYIGDVCLRSITTSSFSLNRGYNSPVRWQACGYIN